MSEMITNGTQEQQKPLCFYWKQWKFVVPIDQITLKGWIEWQTELYALQHRKARPKGNRIYIDTRLDKAVAKARFWNKDAIEKWLNDHGYTYTMTVETRYQFPFNDENEVRLMDADAKVRADNAKYSK